MRELVPAHADEVGRTARAHDEHDHAEYAHGESHPDARNGEAPPQRHVGLARGQTSRELDHDEGAGDEEQPEDQAVVHARVMGPVVVRNPGQEQRVAGNDRRHGRRDQQSDERVEALAVEPDPHDRRRDREEDSEARERQHDRDERDVHVQHAGDARAQRPFAPAREPQPERNGRGRDERELVPVRERPAEPREPAVVAVQPRNHLRGQSNEQDGGQQEPEPRRDPRPRDRRAGEHADDREREVHKRAVRVVPGRSRLDRLGDRQRLEDREGREQPEEGDRRPAEPRRPHDEPDGAEENRQETDPEEPRVARAAGGEEGEGEECAGRSGDPSSACEGLTHRPRS